MAWGMKEGGGGISNIPPFVTAPHTPITHKTKNDATNFDAAKKAFFKRRPSTNRNWCHIYDIKYFKNKNDILSCRFHTGNWPCVFFCVSRLREHAADAGEITASATVLMMSGGILSLVWWGALARGGLIQAEGINGVRTRFFLSWRMVMVWGGEKEGKKNALFSCCCVLFFLFFLGGGWFAVIRLWLCVHLSSWRNKGCRLGFSYPQ